MYQKRHIKNASGLQDKFYHVSSIEIQDITTQYYMYYRNNSYVCVWKEVFFRVDDIRVAITVLSFYTSCSWQTKPK